MFFFFPGHYWLGGGCDTTHIKFDLPPSRRGGVGRSGTDSDGRRPGFQWRPATRWCFGWANEQLNIGSTAKTNEIVNKLTNNDDFLRILSIEFFPNQSRANWEFWVGGLSTRQPVAMKADANISWLSGELTCGMNDESNVKPPLQHKKTQKHTTWFCFRHDDDMSSCFLWLFLVVAEKNSQDEVLVYHGVIVVFC